MRRKVIKEHARSSEESKVADAPLNALEEGESLGFGFVSFSTIEAAAKAKYESKSKFFKGSLISVA